MSTGATFGSQFTGAFGITRKKVVSRNSRGSADLSKSSPIIPSEDPRPATPPLATPPLATPPLATPPLATPASSLSWEGRGTKIRRVERNVEIRVRRNRQVMRACGKELETNAGSRKDNNDNTALGDDASTLAGDDKSSYADPGPQGPDEKASGSDGESPDPDEKTQGSDRENGKSLRKFTRRNWKEYMQGVGSVRDEIMKFTTQKVGHWAIVITDLDYDKQPADERQEIVFEIANAEKMELVPGPKRVNRNQLPPRDFHSEKEDRFNDDEDYPDPSKDSLYMKAATKIREGFEEPDYELLGGVCWDLLDRLRCKTKFTNGEIWHEARRIWNRQRDYRLYNNNCQRFCILLAISIRANQNATLRILNGKITAKQTSIFKACN